MNAAAENTPAPPPFAHVHVAPEKSVLLLVAMATALDAGEAGQRLVEDTVSATRWEWNQ